MDKISVGLGRKLSDGNYGSYDIHVDYQTTVGEGESPEDAYKRATRFVKSKIKREIHKITDKGNENES